MIRFWHPPYSLSPLVLQILLAHEIHRIVALFSIVLLGLGVDQHNIADADVFGNRNHVLWIERGARRPEDELGGAYPALAVFIGLD